MEDKVLVAKVFYSPNGPMYEPADFEIPKEAFSSYGALAEGIPQYAKALFTMACMSNALRHCAVDVLKDPTEAAKAFTGLLSAQMQILLEEVKAHEKQATLQEFLDYVEKKFDDETEKEKDNETDS